MIAVVVLLLVAAIAFLVWVSRPESSTEATQRTHLLLAERRVQITQATVRHRSETDRILHETEVAMSLAERADAEGNGTP